MPMSPTFFATIAWNVASIRRRGEHDVIDRLHTSHAARFARRSRPH
jgi:hypothetical protein